MDGGDGGDGGMEGMEGMEGMGMEEAEEAAATSRTAIGWTPAPRAIRITRLSFSNLPSESSSE